MATQTNISGKSKVASAIKEIKDHITAQLRNSGVVDVDLDELKALKEAAKAHVYSLAVEPFNPASLASDRERASNLKETKERRHVLENRRTVMAARLTNAQELTEGLQAPSGSLAAMFAAAVGFFVLCFAPTAFSAFFGGMEDAFLAWALSIVIGAAVGVFLVLLFLNSAIGSAVNPAIKNPKVLGLLVGLGFGGLRIAKAEGVEGYLVAFSLTLLEWAAVIGLDLYAEKRRHAVTSYRTSQTQILALEHAIKDIDTQIANALNEVEKHIDTIAQRENESFDVGLAAEEASWAVEAAYRAAINANRRALEGGSVMAFQPRTLPALGN